MKVRPARQPRTAHCSDSLASTDSFTGGDRDLGQVGVSTDPSSSVVDVDNATVGWRSVSRYHDAIRGRVYRGPYWCG